MHVEVDQSGRFEYTRQNTVLAFSNGQAYTILISARIKRLCEEKLRAKRVKPPRLQVLLFATALFLLLKEHAELIALVTIDREYYGNEALIKQHLINLFHRAGIPFAENRVRFALIGKESPAHKLALETFRGKRKPNWIITEREILDEL